MPTQNPTRARPKPDLEARYGKIGISAVAAALRCQAGTDNEDAAKPSEQTKERSDVAA